MDEFKVKLIKNDLLRKKAALLELLQRDNRESLKDSGGELSSYDNHPGDLASDTFFRSIDIGLAENNKAEYEKVIRAIERIDQGDYGFCMNCRKPIEPERLHAMPEVQYCRTCQEKSEMGKMEKKRPAEEEVISTIYGYMKATNGSPFRPGDNVEEDN